MMVHGFTASREYNLAYYSAEVDLWENGGKRLEFSGLALNLTETSGAASPQVYAIPEEVRKEGQSHEPRSQ